MEPHCNHFIHRMTTFVVIHHRNLGCGIAIIPKHYYVVNAAIDYLIFSPRCCDFKSLNDGLLGLYGKKCNVMLCCCFLSMPVCINLYNSFFS